MVFIVSLLFMSYLVLLESKHPLKMALTLVMVSGLTAVYAGMGGSKWIMCSIFLIFLGGMMVMFLYVCTLSMNEKFLGQSASPFVYLAVAYMVFMSTGLFSESGSLASLAAFYTYPWNLSVLFLVLYLLSVLFLCVKCVQSFKGALTKAW